MRKYWFLYFILIGLLLLSFTSCAQDDSSLECLEWNEEIERQKEELMSTVPCHEKPSKGVLKQLVKLDKLKCEL